MSIRLIGEPLDSLTKAKVRQLPCTIDFSGKANVAQRFDSCIEEDGDGLSKACFRGYPLVGTELKVPAGYKALVFTSLSDGDNGRLLKAKSTFDKITYYNWSHPPSAADPQQSVDEWLAVADAIHAD